tara:strand:+ start:1660 stop:2028 length:369 start_codon:yes stop_codon:yes gene_type:complete
MIRELIIKFDYHSKKTVQRLKQLETELNTSNDQNNIKKIEYDISLLQQDYESMLKPVALEIAFNINAQLENMTEQEIFDKFNVRDASSTMIANCVYKICQKLERPLSLESILKIMPDKFKCD